MKVKVLRGFCLGQGVDVYPGEEVEIRDELAKVYIAVRKVVAVAPPSSDRPVQLPSVAVDEPATAPADAKGEGEKSSQSRRK